jgi:hypothetical protein
MNFELMDIFVIIGAVGALVVSRNHYSRKWGFILDLFACVAWSYYTWVYIRTPGSIVVQIVYLGAALNGIREHFFLEKKNGHN